MVATDLHTKRQQDVLCFQICAPVSSFVLLASLQSFHGEHFNHVLIHFHTLTSGSVIISHYMIIFGSFYQGLKSNKDYKYSLHDLNTNLLVYENVKFLLC